MVLIRITWFGRWQNTLVFLKGCHQPRVEGGEISFREPWLIGYRGGALGHYFIYNGRGAVLAHSLAIMNILESKTKPKSLFLFKKKSPFLICWRFQGTTLFSVFPPPLNMQQIARAHVYI